VSFCREQSVSPNRFDGSIDHARTSDLVRSLTLDSEGHLITADTDVSVSKQGKLEHTRLTVKAGPFLQLRIKILKGSDGISDNGEGTWHDGPGTAGVMLSSTEGG